MSIGARLSDQAWALPVLAALAKGGAPRVPVLADRLNASRASIADALTHLISLGVLARNEGYGHPLRPEVQIVDAERAAKAVALWQTVQAAEAGAIARQKWTLPVLSALAEPQGFSALSRQLAPITARALSQSLSGLDAAGLARREVIASAPPSTLYHATARALPIVAQAQGGWL